MIQGGEQARPLSTTERVSTYLRHRVDMLLSEIAIGSPELARVGLIALALALQAYVLASPGHFRPAGNGIFAVLLVLSTVGSLVLSGIAVLPLRDIFSVRVRRLLCVAAVVSLCVLAIIGIGRSTNGIRAAVQGAPYSNDGAVMDLYAAQQVTRGHNPYLKTNIVVALAAINAPATTTTPLMRGQFRGAQAYPSENTINQVFMNVLRNRWGHGIPIPSEFESKYNYPAGSFLFILPFVWLGLHDMRFLYFLAMIGMGTYLWFRLPRALRPLAPLLIMGNVPLVALTGGGQPDPMYGLLLLIGLAEWKQSRISPLFIGLAMATKQLAWFFLPFYLVYVVRTLGWKEAGKRSAIMGAVFLVSNGPFILQSPSAYVSSIAGPMADPMFPLGVGIIAVFVSNVLPMAPKFVFTVAELMAWAAGLSAFVRWRLTLAMGAVLAALPLLFAWRSLVNYFYLIPLLALGIALAQRSQDSSQPVRA